MNFFTGDVFLLNYNLCSVLEIVTSMSTAIYMTGTGVSGHSRFYRVFVTADLLGGWSLVREWGEQGAAGQTKIDWIENLQDALVRLNMVVKRKFRQGFKLVQPRSFE